MEKGLKLCARWWTVALALAACASAAYAQLKPVKVRCAPEAGRRCRNTPDGNLFLIDGQERSFLYQEVSPTSSISSCALNCSSMLEIDDVAWPRYSEPVMCTLMMLIGCAPPARVSYMEALRALNVTVTEALILSHLPKHSRITEHVLRDVPPSLELHAQVSARNLEVEPRALADCARIKELVLAGVRVDVMPSQLKILGLYNISTDMLTRRPLTIEELTVEDYWLTTLRVADLKRLQDFKLRAPALASLSLYNVDLKIMHDRFAEHVPRLQMFAMDRVRASRSLPEGFLFGATELRTLKVIDCELNTLPKDLFNYSLKLEHVDLSKNYLRVIPPGLFTRLKQLDTLLLTNNLLTVQAMQSLSQLTWLKVLGLSGNHLGDLCPLDSTSPLWPLHQLKALYLARTRAVSICRDWLSDLRSLVDLDVRNNRISKLDCKDLRVGRGADAAGARIDFTGNVITSITCGLWHYQKALADPVDTQTVTMTLSTPLKCDCESIWFRAVARERRVTLVAPPEFCTSEYIRNLGCEDVLKVSGDD